MNDHMTAFGSLSLGSRLRRLSDSLVQQVSQVYETLDIALHPSCFPLFYLLHQGGARTITDAADCLAVSHPAISRMASRMIGEGWLDKHPDPADERRQLLTLTPRAQQLAIQLTPVWAEIRSALDELMERQEHPLLRSLNEFERLVADAPLSARVLRRCPPDPAAPGVEILPWDSRYRGDFQRLNQEWLDACFPGQCSDQDRQSLANPEGFYLAQGGRIFLAREQQAIVGCCALERLSEGHYQLAKLCVTPASQGRGIGRRLVVQALAAARQHGGQRVTLETASRLTAALHLYQQLGFVQAPPPPTGLRAARADIYMHLELCHD